MHEEVQEEIVKLAERLFLEKVYTFGLKCMYLSWNNDIRVH